VWASFTVTARFACTKSTLVGGAARKKCHHAGSPRLFAYSEEAHGFWASLGWDRFDHPEGPQFHRPLFIQPALSP